MLNFISVITRFPCIVIVESSLLLLIPNERVLYYISISISISLPLAFFYLFFTQSYSLDYPTTLKILVNTHYRKTTHLYLKPELTPH